MNRRELCLAVPGAMLACAPALAWAQPGPALAAAIASPHRSPDNVARDPFRHPLASLTFWGLKPGMTVVELLPGEPGYWREILEPYLAATGGRYIAAPRPDLPKVNLTSGPLAPAGSADMVLVARNIHDWMWTPGLVDKLMKDFNAVLKPGGILAVEEHRADPRPQVMTPKPADDGYVNTAFVVGAVTKAGFKLEASSEINANPKDTKNYPFGVWTLKPTRTSSDPKVPTPPGFDHAKIDAIGESDRMTLRFRKT